MKKFLLFFVIATILNASENTSTFISSKIYNDVSKNAIYDAVKTLAYLSNKENKNRDFLVDAYENRVELTKVNFKYRVIKVDIILDRWILELYEEEKQTRAVLTFIRSDGIDTTNIKSASDNLSKLFWDRLDYVLGINREWKRCSSYFSNNIFSDFCNSYFVTSKIDKEYIQDDISILANKPKINTVDTIKAEIFNATDLVLQKQSEEFFPQEDENQAIFAPYTDEEIFQTPANTTKKAKIYEEDNFESEDDSQIIEDEDTLKFREDLENIINQKPKSDENTIKNLFENSENIKEETKE